MAHCCVERREFKREWLNVLRPIRGTDERRLENRTRRTRIAQTIWRLGLIDSDRVPLNYGIEEPKTSTDRRFSRSSSNFAEQPACPAGRICNAYTRRKLVPLGNQRVRNPWICWINEIGRCRRVDFRLLAENEGRNLVVLFRPVLHQVPANTVVQRHASLEFPTIL